MRKSYLEVNLNNFYDNLKIIKNKVGNNVILAPVIKADGYGTGAVALKNILEENGIKVVAVATTDEAEELRKNDFNMEIISLNELDISEAKEVVDLNVTPAVSRMDVVEAINVEAIKQNKVINLHIEVDTGMGRVGLKPEQMLDFAKEISKLSNVHIEGIFTHFSSADSSKEFTEKQIKVFKETVKELEEAGFEFKYKHAGASSGILFFDDAYFNMVRPGIIMHGYMPDKSIENKWGFKPTTRMYSKIAFVKEVEKDTPIGYSRTYVTPSKKTIATVPLGYADGIRRALSNKGRVYINGKYAPIVGNVCMDNFMIDVTGIDVKVGDRVYIWDNENITLEEVADICGTINYEILCDISKRVTRKYI